MKNLGILVTTLVVALGTACSDVLYPGTDWVVGTWRIAVPDLVCTSADDPPGVLLLRLDGGGAATLSEDGAARVQTRFSTKRDHAAVSGPLVLEFEKPVLGGTRVAISDVPADTLHLGTAGPDGWCRGWKFVRYP